MPDISDRLDTWAEIAAHLGRDVRTARRYESELGLPIRRMPGGDKARVYAFRHELDSWRARSSPRSRPGDWLEATAPPAAEPGLPPARRRRRTAVIAAAIVALGLATLAGAAALLRRPSPAAAAPPARVVLAALQNDTADVVFDRLVPRLLQIGLTQSPRLQVAGDVKVAQTLALMERPRDAVLTPALAREVCTRGNGGVLVVPEIARLAGRYVLTLEASDCVSGHGLWQGREELAAQDQLPQAVDRLAARMRRRLGESQASISRFSVPLLAARTASFDALRAYSDAAWLSARGQDVEAVPLYRRAIELDGRFGLAWLGLAQTLFHARQWREDADAMVHAYALRDSMSERDALFTAYRYHSMVEKDLVAALDSLKALATIYPRDVGVLTSLSFLQFDLGEYADAVAVAEQAMRADPRSPAAAFNLMRALTRSGRAARAKAIGEETARAGMIDSRVYEQRILAEIELGDDAAAKRLLDAVVGTPLERDALLQYAAVFGDGRARAFETTADRADLLGQTRGVRMDWPAVIASLADVGADADARRRLPLVEPDLRVGRFHYAQARVGDPAQTQTDLTRDEARSPKDTLRNAEYGPETRAMLALRRGDPQAAVREMSGPNPFEWRTLEFPYARAQALLAAQQGAAAAAAFRAVLAHTGWSNWPQYNLSHLGLARAQRLQGDTAGARREYGAFLTAWRLADTDLPQTHEARAELAALAPS